MSTSTAAGRRVRLDRATALLLTTLTALLAYAGAAALICGGTDFGATVNERLPWHSPVVAGVGLALLVGVPMTFAAWVIRRDNGLGPAAASVVAGLWLITWIIVQLAVINALNPMQAVCVAVGVALIGVGLSLKRRIGAVNRRVDRRTATPPTLRVVRSPSDKQG